MARHNEPNLVQPDGFEPSDVTCIAVQTLLDAATYTMSAGCAEELEVFHICNLCGECDSHADLCPVPALVRWQTEGA